MSIDEFEVKKNIGLKYEFFHNEYGDAACLYDAYLRYSYECYVYANS